MCSCRRPYGPVRGHYGASPPSSPLPRPLYGSPCGLQPRPCRRNSPDYFFYKGGDLFPPRGSFPSGAWALSLLAQGVLASGPRSRAMPRGSALPSKRGGSSRFPWTPQRALSPRCTIDRGGFSYDETPRKLGKLRQARSQKRGTPRSWYSLRANALRGSRSHGEGSTLWPWRRAKSSKEAPLRQRDDHRLQQFSSTKTIYTWRILIRRLRLTRMSRAGDWRPNLHLAPPKI